MKNDYIKQIISFIAFALILVMPENVLAKTIEDQVSESNGLPYYNNNVWYSLYSSHTADWDGSISDTHDRNPLVYPPSVGRFTFEYWGTGGISGAWRKIEIYDLDQSWTTSPNVTGNFYNTSDDGHHTYNETCRVDATQVSIKINSSKYATAACRKYKTQGLKIELDKHVRLYNGNPDGSIGVTSVTRNYNNVEIGTGSNTTINIRSFLTNTNLTMKIEADAGDVTGSTAINQIFKITYLTTQSSTGTVSITNTANVCGFPGGAGTSSSNQATSINTSSIPVVIEYHPDKIETRKAKLVFYDGTTVRATVHLSGTGAWPEMKFGSVNQGQASTAQTTDLITKFGHNAYTVSALNGYLFSSDGTNWSSTLNVSSVTPSSKLSIKYQPNTTSADGTQYVNITQGGNALKVKVIGTKAVANIQLTSELHAASEVKPFTMSNFTCQGNVLVTAPAGFEVSKSQNSGFGSSITVTSGATYYVRMASTANISSISGTVTMTDQTTGLIHNLAVQGTVTKISSTITITNSRIYLFTNDYNTHNMVGNGYNVHGTPAAIEPFIQLSVPAGDQGVLEVVDGNKLRVVQGTSVTLDRDVTVTASFSGNSTYVAAQSKTFTVRICPVREIDNDPAWQFNTSNNTWYIYQNDNLDLGFGTLFTKDNCINLYLPNVASPNSYFAVRNGGIWDADYPFKTEVYCSDVAQLLAIVQNVTTRSFEDNETTFTMPAKGDDAKLYTRTNPYGDGDHANTHQKYAKFEIKVPRHYHKMKNSESVDFGDVQVGEVAYKDVKLNGTDGLFKSFLTTNGLTIAPASGCPAVFYIEPATEGQSKTLVPANYVLSPYNKINSYDGLALDQDGDYYIRIYFKPLADGQTYSGAFVLSDNGMTLTINVTGTGLTTANEPQYISWGQDLSRLTGSGSMNLTAASNSGLNVSYSGGGSGISLSGSQLNYSGNNTANVTASCNAGINNNVSYDAATPVTKSVTVSTTTPAPGTCGADAINDPYAWTRNNQSSPYTMPATQGFTWNGTGTVTQMTFDLSLVNCATATVKLYVNGTGTSNEIGTFTTAGSKSINLTGRSITGGSTFYCSFYGVSGSSGQDATVSFSITNIQIYYSPNAQQITIGPVDFGTQRVAQAGVTRNIEAIKFKGMNGTLSASITGTDADCFALLDDKNPISYTTTCDEIFAAYDVRFVPRRVSNNLTAYLHVVNPLGGAVDIQLTGKAVKRDTKLAWPYAENSITIDAVGSGNTKSLSVNDNAYIYDKLRGETAKLKIAPNYTVANGTVEMVSGKSGAIIKVNLDNDGYITSVEATGIGSGTAYVIADASVITSSHALFNPTSDVCTLTVNVQKVAPTITFDPTSLTVTYPDDAATGKTFTAESNDDNVGVTWSYSVSPTTGRITVTQNGNVFTVTPEENAGSATITVTASATALYTSGSADFPVTVEWGEMTLDLDVSKLDLSSVTHEEEIAKTPGFITTNYPAGSTTITFSITSWTGDNTTGYLDNTNTKLTLKEIGTIELNVTATHTGGETKSVGTGPLNVRIGTLVFDNHASDNKWMTGENWSPHYDRVPDQTNFDAQISAVCNIAKESGSSSADAVNGVAKCHKLMIGNNLNVSADCVLDVVESIANTTASNFVLKANTTNSATVLFHSGSSPKATIEIYLKGVTHYDSYTEKDNPEWQYRGIVGQNTGDWNSNVTIFRWDESGTAYNESHWVEEETKTNTHPWKGYCMANMTATPATYTYTTELLPIAADGSGNLHSYTLTYTDKKDTLRGDGVNIITNSFSAPVNIGGLEFNNMDQTIHFFKTNTYYGWKNVSGQQRSACYVACPQQTCTAVYSCNANIQAGQAFIVHARKNEASTLTIKPGAIQSTASGAFYMPAESQQFNILSIRITSDSINDEVFLLENENCTKEYDNGYDGKKMIMGGVPQIYANNSFGKTSINADSSMLGQYIGFVGVDEMSEYEISFDIERLEGYDELYLFDRRTKHYANILRGGTYSFTATAGDDPERFQIMGQKDDGSFFTGREQWIEVVGDEALLHGYENEESTIYITDLSGKRVWSDNSKNGPWFKIEGLPAGVYFIHCGRATAKFIRTK